MGGGSDQTEEILFGLIDEVGHMSAPTQIHAFLARIVAVYGLENIAYCANEVPGMSPGEPYLAVTYSEDWVRRYRSEDYFRHDPVLGHGFTSILPFDWRRLDRSARPAHTIFGEAADFGVGRQGLTIPVRGRSGDRALFTVTGNHSDGEWDHLLRSFTKDFQILSFHIHQMVMRSNGALQPSVVLSPREAQCLQWIAQGKTVWETATILALSTRTVRFYLDIARHKLGSTNITHTVGCAIGLGLIQAPAATPEPLS